MPLTPVVISGTVTGANENYFVSCYNVTQGTGTTGTINNSGQYVLDLANTNYVVGDTIYIKVTYGNTTAYDYFTLTQTMIDTGAHTLNMTKKGLREHIYNVFYDIINDNKPASFTDTDGTTTVSWNVLSAFPENTPAFPCIVINPAGISHNAITLNKDEYDDTGSIEIEYFTKAKWKKQRIDNGRDTISEAILDNRDILFYLGIDLAVDAIEDSNIDSFEVGDEKLNIATQVINF